MSPHWIRRPRDRFGIGCPAPNALAALIVLTVALFAAACAESDLELQPLDWVDPDSVASNTNYRLLGGVVADAAASGGRAVALIGGRLVLYDLSVAPLTSRDTSAPAAGEFLALAMNGDIVAAATRDSVVIFDLGDQLVQVARLPHPVTIPDSGLAGLRPALSIGLGLPERGETSESGPLYLDLQLTGGRLHLLYKRCLTKCGLAAYSVDLSEPNTPAAQWLDENRDPVPTSVSVSGNRAVVASDLGLQILDLTDPMDVETAITHETTGSIIASSLADDTLVSITKEDSPSDRSRAYRLAVHTIAGTMLQEAMLQEVAERTLPTPPNHMLRRSNTVAVVTRFFSADPALSGSVGDSHVNIYAIGTDGQLDHEADLALGSDPWVARALTLTDLGLLTAGPAGIGLRSVDGSVSPSPGGTRPADAVSPPRLVTLPDSLASADAVDAVEPGRLAIRSGDHISLFRVNARDPVLQLQSEVSISAAMQRLDQGTPVGTEPCPPANSPGSLFWPSGMDVEADRAFIAGHEAGLVVAELAAPASRATCIRLSPASDSQTTTVRHAGDHVYVGGRRDNALVLDVISVASPERLEVVGSLRVRDASVGSDSTDPREARVRALAGQGSRLVVVDHDHLTTIDVSEPENPQARSLLEIPGTSAIVSGSTLYVTVAECLPRTTPDRPDYCVGGLRIFDMADEGPQTQLGAVPLPGYPSDAVLVGNLLWVAAHNGLYRIDVADPTAPSIVDRVDLRVTQVTAVDDYVFAAAGIRGLVVVSAATGSRP